MTGCWRLAEVRGGVLPRRGVAAGDGAALQALRAAPPTGCPPRRQLLADRRRRRSRTAGYSSRSSQTSPRRAAVGVRPRAARRAPGGRSRASTPRRRASRAPRRSPRRRPCRSCGSPAPGGARRRSSPAGSASRARSASPGRRWCRAAPRPRSCAGRCAARIRSPTPCGSSNSSSVELLEARLGRLLQDRGPGQRVVHRVRRRHAEPARDPAQREPLDEQRAGHDRERDQQQDLAVLGLRPG